MIAFWVFDGVELGGDVAGKARRRARRSGGGGCGNEPREGRGQGLGERECSRREESPNRHGELLPDRRGQKLPRLCKPRELDPNSRNERDLRHR